ncbi:DNA mismatch repair endonuclease MutL, partial [Ruminococcus champanellensis]
MSITVLPKELSELIAAGEVIERPASVIKELVENSIDAGASRITVEIRNGGSVYMRITDDGCGIAPEEVPTAFLRHATSKILEKADLDNIHTLGFRGEALASVAAVGRVEMLTKQAGAEYGVRYQIEGGTECGMERTGCPEGTTIVIRDLFFNVPARQKFLKKDVTESNAVSAIVQKIALSHPEIAFTLIRDHRREFHAAGDGTLYSAIYAVYGRSFAQDLLPVSYSENGISLEGYVIKPLYAKNNRSLQTFFINGRYVKSVTCSVALEEAYRTLVMTGKFPACVLMLTVPPETVDVNVHPAKAAVRFTDEKRVSSAVFFGVKNALMQNGLIYEFQMRPTADWQHAPKEQEPGFADAPLPPVPPLESVQPAKPAPMPAHQEAPVPVAAVKPMPVGNVQVTVHAPEPEEALYMHSPKLEYGAAPAAPEPIREPEPLPETSTVFAGFDLLQDTAAAKQEEPVQAPVPAPEEQPKIRVIGEAFTNYILAQAGDSLY